MKIVVVRENMAKQIMQKGIVYTRSELTEAFWLEHPVYCARLLIKSPVKDRTAIEILEGIITFDKFKIGHNKYERK